MKSDAYCKTNMRQKNVQMTSKEDRFTCPFGGEEHCMMIKVLKNLGIIDELEKRDQHFDRNDNGRSSKSTDLILEKVEIKEE